MVHVYNNYYIDSDDMNYTIKVKVITKSEETGEVKERFDTLAYPTSVKHALNYLMTIEKRTVVREKELEVKELIKEFERIEKDFEELLNSIDGRL